MALKDYAELDEEDYYGQDFATPGVVSVWVGSAEPTQFAKNLDILQDLCGVGYYDLDENEAYYGPAPRDIGELLVDFSFRVSFTPAVVEAARRQGISRARWAIAQFNFAYDPARVQRPIHADPCFLGVFQYT